MCLGHCNWLSHAILNNWNLSRTQLTNILVITVSILLPGKKPWDTQWSSTRYCAKKKHSLSQQSMNLQMESYLKIHSHSWIHFQDHYRRMWSLCPPKVSLLCRSWGAFVPWRPQRLCQQEFWLLVCLTMLDRLWGRGQTKCNTPLMLATSVFGQIQQMTLLCDVSALVQTEQPMAQMTRNAWVCVLCHLPYEYPLPCDAESLECYVGG